jgi:hypothetical protein
VQEQDGSAPTLFDVVHLAETRVNVAPPHEVASVVIHRLGRAICLRPHGVGRGPRCVPLRRPPRDMPRSSSVTSCVGLSSCQHDRSHPSHVKRRFRLTRPGTGSASGIRHRALATRSAGSRPTSLKCASRPTDLKPPPTGRGKFGQPASAAGIEGAGGSAKPSVLRNAAVQRLCRFTYSKYGPQSRW